MDAGVATRTEAVGTVDGSTVKQTQDQDRKNSKAKRKKRKPGIAKASPGSWGESSLAVLFTRPQAEQIGALPV